MLRICLCLLIAVASAGVAAREVKLGSPDEAAAARTQPPTKVTGERVGARDRARASRQAPSPACTAMRPAPAGCSRRAGTASCPACSARQTLVAPGRALRGAGDPITATTSLVEPAAPLWPSPTDDPGLWRAPSAVPWLRRAGSGARCPPARTRRAVPAAQDASPRSPAWSSTIASAACWPRCAACRCSSSAPKACTAGRSCSSIPDAFRVHRSHVDAAGVLHEWRGRTDRRGLGSRPGDPVVGRRAGRPAPTRRAGFCVAVHEMAHKLDVLDGVLDGTPPLPRAWQRAMGARFPAAYDAFAARGRRGARHADRSPTRPRRRRSSSPSPANTTSAIRRCLRARCRRWPRTCERFYGRVAASLAAA